MKMFDYRFVVDMSDNFSYYNQTVKTTRRKNSNISPISFQQSLNRSCGSLSIQN